MKLGVNPIFLSSPPPPHRAPPPGRRGSKSARRGFPRAWARERTRTIRWLKSRREVGCESDGMLRPDAGCTWGARSCREKVSDLRSLQRPTNHFSYDATNLEVIAMSFGVWNVDLLRFSCCARIELSDTFMLVLTVSWYQCHCYSLNSTNTEYRMNKNVCRY